MPPYRLGLLFLVLFGISRRTSAFCSSKISLRKQTRDLCSVQLAMSDSTEELSAQNLSQREPQQSSKLPRAAVSVALRCFYGNSADPKAYYLLIRRGNEPNKGKWALPGGKLEWGETTLEGAKRELSEEVIFGNTDDTPEDSSSEIVWCSEPYAVADAIAEGFHYLIAVCFAECKRVNEGTAKTQLLELPKVTASDDATDARWWSMDEILDMEDDALVGTPGFVRRMKRTEFLYQQGVMTVDETIKI